MRSISRYTWQLEASLCECDRTVMWEFIHRVPIINKYRDDKKAVLSITCVKRKEGKNTSVNETLGQAVSFPLTQRK